MNYQFDFHFLTGSLPLLWEGLQVTLKLALVANLRIWSVFNDAKPLVFYPLAGADVY